jgi:hypothetical protein
VDLELYLKLLMLIQVELLKIELREATKQDHPMPKFCDRLGIHFSPAPPLPLSGSSPVGGVTQFVPTVQVELLLVFVFFLFAIFLIDSFGLGEGTYEFAYGEIIKDIF